MQYPTTALLSQFALNKIGKILFVVGFFSFSIAAEELDIVDVLLNDTAQHLKATPEKATSILERLQTLEPTLTKKQKDKYYLLLVSSLTFRGMYKEEVALVKSKIDQVKDPDVRAGFLYYLSVGHTNLGEYEQALLAMNEGILLLPKLVDQESKVRTLQAAITMFNSLHSYDEALLYADRMSAIDADDTFGVAKCIGLGNRLVISFFQGKSLNGQTLLPKAISICDKHGRTIISAILKIYAAIDLINSGQNEIGIKDGLLLLKEFVKINPTSQYITELEEAIARAYLKMENLTLAERHGSQAYQRAKSQNVVQLQEKSSETMAKIKRAQGQSDSAMDYYEINLALKKKVLDDQLQKNLAYQRVKFDTQDKANQLAQMEQKNKLLTVEKQLQHGKNQNLLLMITLAAILLVTLAAWLLRTLQQKNIFRISSQVDGLTQVANRAHFIATATALFNVPENLASVMLLDMDHFKKVNDTYGHATGDWVLKTVCNTIRAQLRRDDLLGRLGGEEFALCLSDMTQPEVLALAERCRAAIEFIEIGRAHV